MLPAPSVGENNYRNEIKEAPTRNDLCPICTTEEKRKANLDPRTVDPNHNIYELEKGDNEVVVMYKKILKFICLPTKIILGGRLNYNWNPFREVLIWFAMLNLAFAWVCFLYTQCYHIMNGNNIRILEVFGIYGVGISVCTDDMFV